MTRFRSALCLLALSAAACDADSVFGPGSGPAEISSVSVAADGHTVCALSTGGRAYCWGGTNVYGQHGTGKGGSYEVYQTTPARVAGNLRFRAISPGENYACASTADGALYCWGSKQGIGTSDTTHVLSPARVGGERLAEIASLGWGFGPCGITPEGEARCATWQGFSTLAPGTRFTSFASSVVYIGIDSPSHGGYSRAYGHRCGISGTAALCWGDNWAGELGNGTVAPEETLSRPSPPTTTPAPVAGGTQFRAVDTGYRYSCAIAVDDAPWCWGWGVYGQLGTGGRTSSSVPVRVAGGLRLSSISVGSSHTCGVATDGEGWCWGDNHLGQLGNGGSTDPESPLGYYKLSPARVLGGLKWKQISVGSWVTCGVTTTGEVYCWGFNGSGELGNGTQTSSNVPTRVIFPS